MSTAAQRALPPGVKAITWSPDECDALHDEWSFNCGPAAICAITGLTPEQLRPHLGNFESKGHTNPMLMVDILRRLGLQFTTERDRARADGTGVRVSAWPLFGLARLQWNGPWMRSGVPVRARYRHSHWVASIRTVPDTRKHPLRADGFMEQDAGHFIFDVNATCVGGWIPFAEWHHQLVPWLLKQCEPQAYLDNPWIVTNAIELQRKGATA